MGLVSATPKELKDVGEATNALRTELMRHAAQGCYQAGWQSRQSHFMAVIMVLLGAAQRFALQDRDLYAVFKSACGDMARSEADAVVTRAVKDLGPEISAGGIILPGSTEVN